MVEELIKLSTEELLNKFGAGCHKPGSGSAAAFQSLLSAKLTQTVVDLTLSRSAYSAHFRKLLEIENDIKTNIYPSLLKLFQEDSEQFDIVINKRKERKNAKDPILKSQLAEEALNELIPAIEMPIEIAKLAIELGKHSLYILDHGFKSARGDSGTALNGAISSIGSCIFIVNLNLLSFTRSAWTENIRTEVNKLTSKYNMLLERSSQRLEKLQLETDSKNSFYSYIDTLALRLKDDKRKSSEEIEKLVQDIQNVIWKHRSDIWNKNTPKEPMDILDAKKAISLFGFKYISSHSLGQFQDNGSVFEVAGIINNTQKTIAISEKFPLEVRNFTAAHELGHALLHKKDMLHRDKPIDGSNTPHIRPIEEKEADRFAIHFLMPKKQITQSFLKIFGAEKLQINLETIIALQIEQVRNFTSFNNRFSNLREFTRYLAGLTYFNNNSFQSLSERYNVSIETMAIRLEELELIFE